MPDFRQEGLALVFLDQSLIFVQTYPITSFAKTLMMKQILALFCLTLLIACGPSADSGSASNTTQAQTDQSTSVEELEKMEITLDADVEELRQISNSIQIQGRELTPEEMSLLEVFDKIITDYTSWKEEWEASGAAKAKRADLVKRMETLSEQVQEALDLADQE